MLNLQQRLIDLLLPYPYFIFFLSFCLTNAQIENVKITYMATLDNTEIIDKIINDSVSSYPKEIREEHLKIQLSKKPVYYNLYFNDNEALFKKDLILKEESTYIMNMTGAVSKEDRTYYSNSDTKEYLWISDRITPGAFIHLEQVNWEITSETKKIGDYLCYKATAIMDKDQPSRNVYLEPVEAWFTKEILTFFGIQKFHGLSGLTLELTYNRIYDGRLTFSMEKIEFNHTGEKINKPKGTRNMTEKEYVALINRLNDERIMRRLEKKTIN